MKFDHKIRVRNTKEQQLVDMIEQAADMLATELDLHEYVKTVRVERQTGWGGGDTFYAGKWNPNKREIKVNLRHLGGCTFEQILIILCHEMRHAHQWNTGMFKGQRNTFRVGHSSRYEDLPWEIDARQFADVYVQSIAEHLDVKLSKKISGEKLPVWDSEKQRERLATKHKVQGCEIQFFVARRRVGENDKTLPVRYAVLNELSNKRFKTWSTPASRLAREENIIREAKRSMTTATKLAIVGY